MNVVCDGRQGPLSPSFYETATAGGAADQGILATAVCVTLLIPQNTATAVDGVVVEA